jgi:hypothetical protein
LLQAAVLPRRQFRPLHYSIPTSDEEVTEYGNNNLVTSAANAKR